jgi:hypothetical protein
MDRQEAIQQILHEGTKAKISGGASALTTWGAIMLWFAEHKEAITAIGAFCSSVVAVASGCLAMYYLAETQKMKREKHRVEMREKRKNK